MIKGTTPTFKLILNDETVDLTLAQNVYATFKQAKTEITKTGTDIEVSRDEVDVYFTQAETLSFQYGKIEVQLNWTYADGKRRCSTIISVDVGHNLIERVLE